MSLSLFHPATARWFTDTFGTPTAAQERGWSSIRTRQHTLIAAPTGSGKTLAAFLTALDDLLQEGLRAPLPDEVRVVYVSPLKALSADIHKNLSEPRRGIRRVAEALGLEAPRITAAVRTGDTPQAERTAMLRKPPHVLVTTPESLYLLLTAERSREMLRTVRTVIVDEIHAVIGSRRGAHLALSLERLQQVADVRLLRLGLSATQKPIEEVARFLVGTRAIDQNGRASCAIVDEGHRRDMDLDLELPGSPLEAVMSHEVWEEYDDRLTALIGAHRTTIVFVNTRRMAERLARYLSERLGDAVVTAHHGSLSKEKRLDAETRLKAGQLKALVATASLELGIDIGHVDLVCQIGSPHRIATLIQRVGRSGHTVSGTPKGRLFPTSRDDLVECVALLGSVRRGDLDAIVSSGATLDVLTQQIVAETACREYTEDELFALVRGAWPFHDLDRPEFDSVVRMAAEGFATRRGRRGALIFRDEVTVPGPWAPWSEADGPHLGRSDPRGGRLPGGSRTRRHLHRDAERGLRDRKHGRRRLSARKRLLASAAGWPGNGARRRRERGAAEPAVLAGGGAGTDHRTVAGRQRSSRRRQRLARSVRRRRDRMAAGR